MLAIIASTLLFFLLPVLLPVMLPSTAHAGQTGTETQAVDDGGNGSVEVSQNATEARDENISFAVVEFLRMNKGTNKAYNDISYGYRFPMSGKGAFAIVVTDEMVIVYLPLESIRDFSIDINDPSDQAAFKRLLFAIDEEASSGGILLKNQTTPYLFISEASFIQDRLTYSFAVEVEPGQYYVCITSASDTQAGTQGSTQGGTQGSSQSGTQGGTLGGTQGSSQTGTQGGTQGDALDADNSAKDASSIVYFVDSGLLVPADAVFIDRPPEGFDAVWEFFGGIDYRPFWISMRTSLVAMIFVFVLGLAAAHFSQKTNTRIKGVLDSIFTIPMVLPPTVCGFLLLVLFGNSTGFGRWLIEHGIVLVFTWPGAVFAAFVVAFPLMYRTARGAFEGLDPNLGDAARTLGWSETRVFFRLTLPLSWPSIAAGTVLSFARALGEFGATLFVAGNFAGKTQTMPLAIYFQWMGGRTEVATFWVVVIILISFFVILLINWYASRTQRYRQAGSDIDTESETGLDINLASKAGSDIDTKLDSNESPDQNIQSATNDRSKI